MPHTLKDEITIGDADGGNKKPYKLLVDRYDQVQWFEEGVSDDSMPPGEPVRKKWRFWSGMGETLDMGRGGYYYSQNAYHGNPFTLKPRPYKAVVTLTANTVPVERIFEAKDSGGVAYLYALAAAKSFKVKLSDQTLKETKDFTTTGFYFASGKYLGDGKDNRQIKGVGFKPDAVILKSLDNTSIALLKTSTMGQYTKKWSGYWAINAIKSLDGDGFTVSDASEVNLSGIWYYWQAWKADGSSYIKVGSYEGNGVDGRQYTDVGFQPDLVHICRAASSGVVTSRSSSLSGDKSFQFYNDADVVANRIQDFIANGFELGDDADVNNNGDTYHYVAFKLVTGAFAVGSYAGNGADDRSITGFGFAPTYAIVVCESAADSRRALQASHKWADPDTSWWFYQNSEATNYIQAFEPDGIQVGSDNHVNRSGSTFHWMAWRGRGAVGKPAPWNRNWRVPIGSEAGIATLQVVNDEAANPGSDDTWVVDPIPADHLERLGNKLARACLKRYVSLCSADDIGNLANWGAEYPVGPPDCEITDLVEWSTELGVCAKDGMYMFDGVATSKQQLPLLGSLKDDDNGKNTLRWASYILYPSADGYWRWRYGEHIRIDSDAIPGNVPAPETTDEPLNLKHYGSAFCGDHIYHACYDGTKYHLMHGRPRGDGFVWDCLITTINAIKVVYLDSDRRLWFGWGNDLAWIQLSQGGEPDGGNFGEASLVTRVYLPQVILADDIDVRLRMLKVICRNSDDEYEWEIYASRDGARPEIVNYLQDPSFERGDEDVDGISDGWEPGITAGLAGDVTFSLPTAQRKYGAKSQRVQVASASVAGDARVWQLIAESPVAAEGEVWTASAWAYIPTLPGTSKVHIVVHFFDAGDNLVGYETAWLTSTNAAFECFQVTGTAPATTAYARMRVGVSVGSGDTVDVYFDGCQLEKASAATDYCDGDQPGGQWNGTFHESISRRAERVGSAVSSDGVTKLYWDPTANLTARRLRLEVGGRATASFTPTTTPPEIIGIEFFGETVPDDAEVIRAVIDLESFGRSAKKIKTELKARENAGVCQVRDPIEDTMVNVIIYQCNLAGVRQKGYEKPTAGMMIWMRRGDTS